jgi:large subunit ribosomal protein L28
VAGRQYARRGKAKKKGGVGRKITGKTNRWFKPNIQRVRALIEGKVRRIKVCTTCLRSGKIIKPG